MDVIKDVCKDMVNIGLTDHGLAWYKFSCLRLRCVSVVSVCVFYLAGRNTDLIESLELQNLLTMASQTIRCRIYILWVFECCFQLLLSGRSLGGRMPETTIPRGTTKRG